MLPVKPRLHLSGLAMMINIAALTICPYRPSRAQIVLSVANVNRELTLHRRSRAALFVLLMMLAALRCFGVEAPVPIEPVSAKGPGPALDDSTVGFRWSRTEGATGYQLMTHDLSNGEDENYLLPATRLFNNVSLVAGHQYHWHVEALVGTNVASVSTTNYFTIALKPVYPVISGVLPLPVPASDGPQVLVVNGKEFRRGLQVVLRDTTTGERFSNFKVAARRNGQFVITPDFKKSAGTWTVEVLNPGGFSSGPFAFPLVAPEGLRLWHWKRSGWPWTIASVVAAAFAIIWLFRQYRQIPAKIASAEEEARRREHERMSRDLHDSINDLNQINLLAGTLKPMVEKEKLSAEIQVTAGKVSFAVVEAINGIQDMIWASREESESLVNLVARLRRMIGQFSESNPQLRCELEFPIDVPEHHISCDFSAHLLRISSEALRNIVKHAAATKVTCQLILDHARLRFTIADNGRGFQLDGAHRAGHGLSNLHRRAKELGGSLTFQSSPGSGTKIIVEVPLVGVSPATGDS